MAQNILQICLHRESLCEWCEVLTNDVLSNSKTFGAGWQTMRSPIYTLTYLEKHRNGKLASLLQSAEEDCNMCFMIANQVRISSPRYDAFNTYQLFVWDETPQACEFQLSLGGISQYLEHISTWKSRPLTFQFCSRNGASSNRESLIHSGTRLNPARSIIPALPNLDSGSDEAVTRAKEWLAECKKHEKCSRPNRPLPKRVLDLSPLESMAQIFLYETKGEIAPYATLSYAWGISPTIKTTDENIAAHICGIKYDALPKTMRDAIRIAKRLGFQYLWIDALCIIQDQNSGKDWNEQAVAMTDIYYGSTLNLSALSSHNTEDGMLPALNPDGPRIGTFWLGGNEDRRSSLFVIGARRTLDLSAKSLSSRGWTFQERLVSIASLHYTDEGMVWECASGQFLEHNQSYRDFDWKTYWGALVHSQNSGKQTDKQQTFEVQIHGRTLRKTTFDLWNRCVCEFSRRNLTKFEDKLPAMAGIAKYISTRFGLMYQAGLWKDNFLAGLLWHREHATAALVRHGSAVAPSWSWASVTGRLVYENYTLLESGFGHRPVIHGVDVEEKEPETFGRVHRTGAIFMQGWLQEVTLNKVIQVGKWRQPFREFEIVNGVTGDHSVHCLLDEYSEDLPCPYDCWCLQLGIYSANGRLAGVFLLLRSRSESNQYERVGIGKEEVWDTLKHNPNRPASFESGSWSDLQLI